MPLGGGATAASRAAAVSSSVSVRSGARKRSANASDLRPRRHLGAGVDVEQPHRLQQRAGALAQRGRHGRPRHGGVDHEGDVLLGDRDVENPAPAARPGRAPSAGRGRSRRRRCAAGTPERPADPRVQLAGVADDRARRRSSSAQRPGCQGAAVGGSTSRSTPSAGATSRTASIASAQAAGAARAPPAGALALAGEHDGEVQRLVGHGGVERGQLLVGRAGGRRRRIGAGRSPRRAGRRVPISNSAMSGAPRPTLRASALSSPGSSVVVQQRLLGRQRVGQPDGAPARVVGGQPERVEVGLADEREA